VAPTWANSVYILMRSDAVAVAIAIYRAEVFAQRREVEFMRRPRMQPQVWLRQVFQRLTLAFLRVSSRDRVVSGDSEPEESASARFLCLKHDIDSQLALRELHYPPIRYVHPVSSRGLDPSGMR